MAQRRLPAVAVRLQFLFSLLLIGEDKARKGTHFTDPLFILRCLTSLSEFKYSVIGDSWELAKKVSPAKLTNGQALTFPFKNTALPNISPQFIEAIVENMILSQSYYYIWDSSPIILPNTLREQWKQNLTHLVVCVVASLCHPSLVRFALRMLFTFSPLF